MQTANQQSGAQNNQLSAVDRSQRSVFVGNISYEATEDQLKEIFSKAGSVVHFRLVFDRDTGKPKGYGFCEYVDDETAQSAIRNLNGQELHGRTLRVDSAAGSERNKEEMRQLQMTLGGPQEESPYGPPVEQGKAPESISRAVASLPPEQMFELMKQMKLCIQNNPNEARNMLLQNPQLAYALLQAQVVMRIVDPQIAMNMLHKDSGSAPVPAKPMAPVSSSGNIPMVGSVPPVSASDPRGTPVMSHHMMPPRGPPPPTGLSMPMERMQNLSRDTDYRHDTFGPPPGLPRGAPPMGGGGSKPEDEKANLIVQVLQLTDEQINLLPPDQKQSVLILRERLRSSQS